MKSGYFTRRLTTCNETFAAISRGRLNFSALWNEGKVHTYHHETSIFSSLAVRCEPPCAQQTARKIRASIHGPGYLSARMSNLLFKISFAGVERESQIEPNSRSRPRGVHPKKNDIVNKLLPLIPTQGRRSGISCP
ncbi:hypothetical protein PoB_001750600 [Plakobranchus ocellatus]|uniref:Uncharacterized protein n=1 Tax=Plakobranchus ocellatus TaxID=259542 RepID=A0AAV3Z8P4_9GAST|nr:hypothetical protein PoB_001750600 [Plakobranchus ocellatus]